MAKRKATRQQRRFRPRVEPLELPGEPLASLAEAPLPTRSWRRGRQRRETLFGDLVPLGLFGSRQDCAELLVGSLVGFDALNAVSKPFPVGEVPAECLKARKRHLVVGAGRERLGLALEA